MKNLGIPSSFPTFKIYILQLIYWAIDYFALNKWLLYILATSYRMGGTRNSYLKLLSLYFSKKVKLSIAFQPFSPGLGERCAIIILLMRLCLSTKWVILDVKNGITMYFRYKFGFKFILFQWLYNTSRFALVSTSPIGFNKRNTKNQ